MLRYNCMLLFVLFATSLRVEGEESIQAAMGDIALPLKGENEGSVQSKGGEGEGSVPSKRGGDEDGSVPSKRGGDEDGSVPSKRDGTDEDLASEKEDDEASVSLTEESKNEIVNTHNELRKKEKAENMKKLVWNTVLEEMAQGWADKCKFAHGQPLSPVSPYEYTGQNIYAKSTFPSGDINYERIVGRWYGEKLDYDFESKICNKICGHYTQVVWHDTTDIGCAAKECPTLEGTSWTNALVVVCNYGPPGNWKGEEPYKKGDACAECPDSCEDGLCKV